MVKNHQVLSAEEATTHFQELIEKLPDNVRKDFEDNARPFLEKYGYFFYPASVRYHLNQEGGLFRHSVKIALNALELNKVWFDLPEWKVIIASLFHDLGKLGNVDFYDGEQYPRYKVNPKFYTVKLNTPENVVIDDNIGFSFANTDSGKIYPFEYGSKWGDEKKGFVHADMTVLDGMLPMKIMHLPADVVQACQFADGHYVPSNDNLKLKVLPLSYLIHWSDMYTGILEEGGYFEGVK